MSVEELVGDWHGLDLAEEAVVVDALDGRIAGYADVLNRACVTVSTYGYVHPAYRGRGVGTFLVAWGAGRATTYPRLPGTRASSRSTTSTPPTRVSGNSWRAPATRPCAGCARWRPGSMRPRHHRAGPQVYASAPSSPAGIKA
jgi:GNAT superfamily N-acetyltransferase